jgi:hypothetical protein
MLAEPMCICKLYGKANSKYMKIRDIIFEMKNEKCLKLTKTYSMINFSIIHKKSKTDSNLNSLFSQQHLTDRRKTITGKFTEINTWV